MNPVEREAAASFIAHLRREHPNIEWEPQAATTAPVRAPAHPAAGPVDGPRRPAMTLDNGQRHAA